MEIQPSVRGKIENLALRRKRPYFEENSTFAIPSREENEEIDDED
jgi:hypothetical protein